LKEKLTIVLIAEVKSRQQMEHELIMYAVSPIMKTEPKKNKTAFPKQILAKKTEQKQSI